MTLSDKFKKVTRLLGGDTGASAVEFALILPILILLVFGTIQFGILYNRMQGLQAAAREGARLAAIGGTFDQIQTRVRNAQSLFTDTDVTVATTPASAGTAKPCAAAGVGNEVTVTASVAASGAYAIDIPLFGTFEIDYNSAGVFRCEHS